MKFEEKISGTRVEDFKIKPIFENQYIWLTDVMTKIKRQETMDFLLDNFRFYKGEYEKEGDWVAIIDFDTIYKLSVMENYPQYEKEFVDYFGENWLNHYIRFNH